MSNWGAIQACCDLRLLSLRLHLARPERVAPEQGGRQQEAIHSLREESGSLIASTFGIEAAHQHLGHRDIRTTSSHDVDRKKRIEVRIPVSAGIQQAAS